MNVSTYLSVKDGYMARTIELTAMAQPLTGVVVQLVFIREGNYRRMT